MVCCLKFFASINRTWRRLIRRPSMRLTTIRTCWSICGVGLPQRALEVEVLG